MQPFSFRFYAHFCVIISCIFSCAEPSTPTGGDRDKTPPVLVNSTPSNRSIDQKPKKITFYFDENIQVKNAQNNVVISPIITPAPKVTKTNKSITIEIPENALQPNTTYSVSLNNVVSDLNEGNAGTYTPLLFSTGNQIDTLSIPGQITYRTNPKKESLKLWCFNGATKYTSLITEHKFHIRGVDSNAKRILIFNDENNNNLPDTTEDIGFQNSVKPAVDTVDILMYNRKKNTIYTASGSSKHYIHGLAEQHLFALVKQHPNLQLINDTLFADEATITSIKASLNRNYYIVSSIKSTVAARLQVFADQRISDSSSSLFFAFNRTVASIDTSKIQQISTNDSVLINSLTAAFTKNTIQIRKQEKAQSLLLLPGAVAFEDGSTNTDSIKASYTNYNSVLHLTNSSAQNIFASITISNKNKIVSIAPGKSERLYVPQGTYNIYYFIDSDNNLLLTPPDPVLQIEGERWNILPKVTANSKLENEIILK